MKKIFISSICVLVAIFFTNTIVAQDQATTQSAQQEQTEKTEQKDKGTKVKNYIAEHFTFSGYAHIGYSYDSYDMKKGADCNSFFLQRAILVGQYRPVKNLLVYYMGDVAKFKLQELYAKYQPVDAFYVKFGQYKTPFSIENNMSNSLTEYVWGALAVQYMSGIDGSDACFGSGSGRDLGLEVGGAFLKIGKTQHNFFEYRVGVFNGERVSTFKDSNKHKDISASLYVVPVKGLKFFGSVYFGEATAQADNYYGAFKAGEQYRRDRWSVGIDFKRGPIYLRTEYMEGMDADIHSRGGYVTLNGSATKWLDILASVDYLNRNTAIDDNQMNYILGFQWNIYKKCRLQLQYVYHQRPEHAQAEVPAYYMTAPSSHEVVTRLQVGF